MKPILFSTEMVRAILDLRKDQTRRTNGLEDVNKSPDIWSFNKVGILDYMTKPQYKGRFGAYFETESLEPNTLHICPVVCPYGKPGDLLWVRETWAEITPEPFGAKKVIYRSDGWEWKGKHYSAWRPSIFMPRWASRITLKITDLKAERLQDISEADAKAEGTTPSIVGDDLDHLKYRAGFMALWDSINAKRGYPWESNPWVWVIELERVDGVTS